MHQGRACPMSHSSHIRFSSILRFQKFQKCTCSSAGIVSGTPLVVDPQPTSYALAIGTIRSCVESFYEAVSRALRLRLVTSRSSATQISAVCDSPCDSDTRACDHGNLTSQPDYPCFSPGPIDLSAITSWTDPLHRPSRQSSLSPHRVHLSLLLAVRP